MTTVAAAPFVPLIAKASAINGSLVVSLHDITPSNREIAQKILTELARHGVRVCSLLVVPDYHHHDPITKDPPFVTWLRDLLSEGHEIVIHGYFHERPRRGRGSLWEKFVTQFYTRDEGEFFDLDYDEALSRIVAARDEFRAVGLNPRGFIAPAWLLSTAAERAAHDAEMEYTTRLGAVRDLRMCENFPARSLVYSVQTGWRRAISRAWNAGLYCLVKHDPLVRLSIHPGDYFHPAIWSQISQFVKILAKVRTPMTYEEWIGERRIRGTRLL